MTLLHLGLSAIISVIYEGESESKRQFRDNFSSTDGGELHMLLFHIVSLHNDVLLPLHVLTWVPDQGMHPLDVLVRAWYRWTTRSAFIRYTCSSILKAFYPRMDLSLMHGVRSILCQNPVIDFRRFNPLCPQKAHYGAVFLDGAIAEWSGHTSNLVAVCDVTERWNSARG
jgi:hypothetical protein